MIPQKDQSKVDEKTQGRKTGKFGLRRQDKEKGSGLNRNNYFVY